MKNKKHLNILFAELLGIRRGFMDGVCRRRGHNLDTAMTGEQAVKKAKEKTYDLIFIDDMYEAIELGCGNLTGLSAIQKIREFNKKTPVYFTSKESVNEYELKKSKATGFVRKDINSASIWDIFNSDIKDFMRYDADIENVMSRYEGKYKKKQKKKIKEKIRN